ncbi:hypothetical protein A3H10_04195 [Candidatus Uhrbacteria bacterium RIFCSPLOWO2_12_FULL_46_10]|uniref:Uncharacterized protein n=1 Tax=Candidatus Uhrbacteria bacterium RIFCSPLOWO2_01_FULL_47_25 TaxID=1802402 RepID=A0A1F7UX06_9BACT|nr:MAG: hypothetical protein A2752_03460 [Candidatus Uhrbacteria bacterium RIFCSPHIGHO2_01_FULL_46_23]OGL70071.1 MAG: hypothetical protein A3D60_03335 [Candidatus Uhrbacteria bacterium RIFCSPHIGHO2_02_FULL_47_29]OGL75979.1 MAG: hypothetical protein A3E96_01970 [Candidatus Uhrbacteria bacterium RIFCSPHIGHO2_12_FULL_46_13]OGL82832.1 MAG: hypothetical protein A2936_04160 [Candidatus Uhrbacteria bacterium RIFCSPLOWO2_01_FULL_47_25]OGL84002.1 MAG: hypothetical protein A3I37_04665 [Candidatus Uhrbact
MPGIVFWALMVIAGQIGFFLAARIENEVWGPIALLVLPLLIFLAALLFFAHFFRYVDSDHETTTTPHSE